MVSGALGKISRGTMLPPSDVRHADSRYFCSPVSPLWRPPSLGALGSCPSRLPLHPPLITILCAF